MQQNLHSDDDDLQEIAPLLSKIPKKSFQVPESYFEEFPNKILSEIAKEKSEINWISIAATIIIILGIGITLHTIEHQNIEHPKVSASIDMSDLDLYEIDESLLIEFASTSDESIKQTNTFDEMIIENYSESELLEHYN